MISVGQKLWFVPAGRYGAAYGVTVAKIGRKWATLEGHDERRVDLQTLEMDGRGYSSPGRCYISREDYEHKCALSDLWSAFRRTVDRERNTPKNATVDAIKHAAELLGLTVS